MAQCGGDLLPRRMHRDQETVVEGICQGLLDLDDDDLKSGASAMCGAFGYLQQEWPDLSVTNLDAPGMAAPGAGNGNDDDDSSCSAGGGFRKRKPDARLDAKSDHGDGCKTPREKQQRLSDLGEVAWKGNQERPKAGTKKKADVASSEADQKTDYIHVRARRGQATDNHSLAERVRRERISERMRYLQDLVPGCSKVTGKAGMLDEIINYVQSLQNQVEFLSMKIAASNPVVSFDIVEDLFGRQLMKQACNPGAPPAMALPAGLQISNMPPAGHLPAGSSGFGLEMVVNSPYPPAAAGGSNASCFNVDGAAAAAVWDIGSRNLFSGFDAQFQPVESDCLLHNLKMEM